VVLLFFAYFALRKLAFLDVSQKRVLAEGRPNTGAIALVVVKVTGKKILT
jgi:hypothetical protein